MPRLSYRSPVKIYAIDSDSDAWQLIKESSNLRITPISDAAAIAEGERFAEAASVTHRGRCAYDVDLDAGGPNRRLLVREPDGVQFLVLRWRSGRGYRRAAKADMILSLVLNEPKYHNLYDT